MKTSNEEEKGIEAIIHLQSLVGITEARKKALAGWRRMSNRERAFTLEFYQAKTKDQKKHENINT